MGIKRRRWNRDGLLRPILPRSDLFQIANAREGINAALEPVEGRRWFLI
jgi:hypothetical protein